MDLGKVWSKERAKRSSFAFKRQRGDRNWPIHKRIVLNVLKEFAVLSKPYRFYHVVDFCEADPGLSDGPSYQGQDSVVLTEMNRITPKSTVYTSGDSTHIKHIFETGGSLVVHYTYEQSLIQVFLTPPRMDDSVAIKPEILLWTGRNTDDLTEQFAVKLVAKYLMYCRAESSFQKANFFERLQVRWWKYMDVRNRQQATGGYTGLLNLWEATFVMAIIAVIGVIASVVAI